MEETSKVLAPRRTSEPNHHASGNVVHERERVDLVVVRAALEEAVAGLDRQLLAGVHEDSGEDVLRAALRRSQRVPLQLKRRPCPQPPLGFNAACEGSKNLSSIGVE